jgi:hypothetical protein
MIPKRRKAEPLGLRQAPQLRSSGHLKFIRGFDCAAKDATPNLECAGRIEAAHVRANTDGGMGVKPSDNFTLPLCSMHHHLQHQLGEKAFEQLTKISMRKIADALWAKSPHRLKGTG